MPALRCSQNHIDPRRECILRGQIPSDWQDGFSQVNTHLCNQDPEDNVTCTPEASLVASFSHFSPPGKLMHLKIQGEIQCNVFSFIRVFAGLVVDYNNSSWY